MGERNIQFYYVQCYDKHSIYPEQMMDTLPQYGDVSKTDQILNYLKEKTTVELISMKDILLQSKSSYEVYSKFNILCESEYDISIKDLVSWINDLWFPDELEDFQIHTPKAELVDTSFFGTYAYNKHRCWNDKGVDNNIRLLIMGDSYINSLLLKISLRVLV